MNNLKNWLNTASGVLGFLVTFSFGVWLLRQSGSQSLNVASWIMWTLMDGVLVALSIRGGNKKPFLFIGWTLAALLVTAGMLINGAVWQIGFVEMVSIGAVILSVYFWVTDKSEKGLFACAVAMFVAGLPQIASFWNTPATGTWWLWAGTAFVCALSILGSAKWKSAHNAPTISSFVYQIVVLAVLFR